MICLSLYLSYIIKLAIFIVKSLFNYKSKCSTLFFLFNPIIELYKLTYEYISSIILLLLPGTFINLCYLIIIIFFIIEIIFLYTNLVALLLKN